MIPKLNMDSIETFWPQMTPIKTFYYIEEKHLYRQTGEPL